MQDKIGVVIPVFHPPAEFQTLLDALLCHPRLAPAVLADSAPGSAAAQEWRKRGCLVYDVAPGTFSHGRVREQYRKAAGTRYVLFLTQDVLLRGGAWLEPLAAAVTEGGAAAAYARQLPHQGADFFAAFDRSYNYPPRSVLQNLQMTKGVRGRYFCSNSCALWDNDALDAVGGFPPVNHNEDMLAAARLVNSGRTVAYVAEAEVYHSHDFVPAETFRRFLAIGRELRQNAELFGEARGHGASGSRYVKALLGHVLRERPWLLPKALLAILCKAGGYYAGKYAFPGKSGA